MSGLATDLLRGVGAALSDLERAVRDVAGWRDLLSELGWDPVPLPPAIAAIATPAGEVVAAIAALERGVTPASIDRARTAVVAVVDAIDGLSSLDLGATGLGADLAAATFDHLVIAWLAREHPLLYAGLIVAGLIEVHYVHEHRGAGSTAAGCAGTTSGACSIGLPPRGPWRSAGAATHSTPRAGPRRSPI